MSEYNNKFKPGDIVYYLNIIKDTDCNIHDYCELSIEEIESLDINKKGEYHYWLSGEDSYVSEDTLVSIDNYEKLGKILRDGLRVAKDFAHITNKGE